MDSSLFQFQAAIALRQTAVIHWHTYSEDQQHQLNSHVVQSVLKRALRSKLPSPKSSAALLQFCSNRDATALEPKQIFCRYFDLNPIEHEGRDCLKGVMQ